MSADEHEHNPDDCQALARKLDRVRQLADELSHGGGLSKLHTQRIFAAIAIHKGDQQ